MRGAINDSLRWLIGRAIAGLGLALEIIQRIRIKAFFRQQQRLRRRYQITAATPVLAYGPELEQRIQRAAAHHGRTARFALTSGSTAQAKRILYTKRRLRSVKLAYVDHFARCCSALSIRRTSLYVFSSFGKDESLTSMLLDETRLPLYLSALQAPYRVQSHPVIQALASRYGATALRLWLLSIANPGVLYSTNPSTLSTFLDELATDWRRSSGLIRDWSENPDAFDGKVRMIARRLDSRGSAQRLARIAGSTAPLHLRLCAPGVKAYICWTGGYVKPFLDRLRAHLPPAEYRLIQMYSMSTETGETVGHFRGASQALLPLAPRVLYEFIEEGSGDHPENLRTADQLQTGKTYTLIVSDPYGLRRYQTDDLFLCKGFVSGLPDLDFVRRRGLEYSFTGEKLTAQQVSTVFQQLRRECAWLKSDDFLTCVPSQPEDEPVPHYKLILIGAKDGGGRAVSGADIATRCDALLSEINSEYKSKRESKRLGQVRLMSMSLNDFIERIGGPRQRDTWEAQFKFLPLYQRTWESLTAPSRSGLTRSGPSQMAKSAEGVDG